MTPQEIATQAEELFKEMMQMYWAYLQMLEVMLKHTDPNNVERLEQIRQQAEEAQEAMQHDIGVFDKALGQDMEGMKKYQENDEIEAIQRMLKAH